MHENEAISIKTRLKAPVLARITSIFEISTSELIIVTHCHKFPPRVTNPPSPPGLRGCYDHGTSSSGHEQVDQNKFQKSTKPVLEIILM